MGRFLIYLSALMGAGFLVAGGLMFYSQVLRGRKEAEAEILSAEVERFEQTDDGRTVTLYRSKYQIRFDADGRVFTLPLRSLTGTSKPEPAQARLQANPVGSRRSIYYLPERPEDFVFEPLARRIGFALLCFTVGLAGIAVTALLRYQSQPLEW
jgi:hypothetical protein